jgi:hypothetical protein
MAWSLCSATRVMFFVVSLILDGGGNAGGAAELCLLTKITRGSHIARAGICMR